MMEIFDLDSIEMNKQGQKSEKQRKEIKEAANPGVWLWGGLGVLLLGGCSYFALTQMNGGGGGPLDFLGILLAIVGLVAALRGFTMWNLRRELLKEPVQTAEGTVSYEMKNIVAKLVEADHYTARTNDGKVLHPIGLAGVNPKLPPGLYNFYYLNTRNWLLASEPLSSEAELRANLNSLLAAVFGYDQASLEKCRQEARTGALKTVEGLPKLDAHEYSVNVDNQQVQAYQYYCSVGDMRFEINAGGADAIFESLPHRIYYREDKKDKLAAIEVV